MKKKFLSIVLAGAVLLGAGMLFVGCGDTKWEDQAKLHDKFCTATSSMSSYREPVTYIYDSDLITEKATYNNETKEFAYLKLSAGGNILAHENTKIFDDDIAYYSKTEEKVNEEGITFMLQESQTLWLKAGDVSCKHNDVAWQQKVNVGNYIVEHNKYDRDKGEYITISEVSLKASFRSDTAYYIYITG